MRSVRYEERVNEMSQYLMSQAGLFLFLVVFAEQIGVPMPAAPLLVLAGGLAASGALDLGMAIGVTLVACVIADLIWFYLGWRGGDRLLRSLWRFFHGDAASFERTERFFARHGMSAVAAAKFVPVLGLLIPPLSGVFKVELRKFLWFELLGSLFYAIVYLGLGFVFGEQVTGLLGFISGYGGAITAGAALIVIFIAWRYVRLRKEPVC
jgi:membrane protein DedA with SNARE-associated domain